MSIRIDPHRLITNLLTLRKFGAEGNGVVRTTFSPPDIESRHWLRSRYVEAGLEAEIDGVGNVFGFTRHPGKRLLLGSHSDTQVTGGWLDGALGVIYALEVALTLQENDLNLAVDVVSWSDEESSFLGTLGSRSFCGLVDAREIDLAIGKDGRTLRQALADCGLAEVPEVVGNPDNYLGYLEAHIEQGPFLEAERKTIGVVTSIVGMMDFEIVFSGEQNHAGTTPMTLRKDAGMALMGFVADLNQRMKSESGPHSVWTAGRVNFEPGAPSIVPGRATMHWQFRDPEQKRVMRFSEVTEQAVAAFNATHDVHAKLSLTDESASAQKMDETLVACLGRAAEGRCPGKWMHMPSGAAHDAQILAQIMPAAMLFIPSIGGVSHSFAEDSHQSDIVAGCQVMLDAVVERFSI